MTQYIKKFNITQKSPIKPKKAHKTQKKNTWVFFLIKPGFLPALVSIVSEVKKNIQKYSFKQEISNFV